MSAPAGFLFAYFTGEHLPDGEQVRFAVSRGDSPLVWDELDGGRPILTSTLGQVGVRDPFLVRDPIGGGFFLVATDLRIHPHHDWMTCQRTGSRSIVVWQSPDLVTWSEPWLAEVAGPEAGNVWAPEVTWHEESGSFAVYWASMLYPEDDPEHTGDSYNRMLLARTRDFRTFTPATVWVDPGHSVIDSTVIEHDGVFYRFSKDERDVARDAVGTVGAVGTAGVAVGTEPATDPTTDPATPLGKSVLLERSADLLSTQWEYLVGGIGIHPDPAVGIRRGEGPCVVKSLSEERWYLFIDEYGERGYLPFESTDLAAGPWTLCAEARLPADPRHGSILAITAAERDLLLHRFGGAEASVQ